MIFFISCKKQAGTNIYSVIDLSVLDANGKNLLAVPAVFHQDNIQVFYVIKGKPTLISNYDVPDHGVSYFLIDSDKATKMRLTLHNDKRESQSLTLVKFGNLQTDTIRCEFHYEGSNVALTRLWINGIEKNHHETLTLVK